MEHVTAKSYCVKIKRVVVKNPQGFTLIEILVVISIIALLAAILFPVFSRARENARRTNCQSNLKQIALGINIYVQDYDGKFPHIGNPDTSTLGWAERLQPQLKSVQVFQCPSEMNEQNLLTDYTDYYYNLWLGNKPSGVPESIIDYPANTIMNGDGNSTKSNYYCEGVKGPFAGCGAGSSTGGPFDPASATVRHLEGANYSFVDGHVKWLKRDALMDANGTTVVNGTNYGFKFAAAS